MDISIVIPTYNGARFLRNALESIYSQTRAPQEIIVVDDASTDGTIEAVESISKSAPISLRLIRLEQNSGGPSRPLNLGIAAAHGELIAVLDQDDQFLPKKLATQADILAENLTIRFAVGGVIRQSLESGGSRTDKFPIGYFRDADSHETCLNIPGNRVRRTMAAHGNIVTGYPSFMFRRQDWIKVGGIDESLRIAGDFDFLAKLCSLGTVSFSEQPVYLRIEHALNLCNRQAEVLLEGWKVRESIFNQDGYWNETDLLDVARSQYLQKAQEFRWTGRHEESWQALKVCRRLGLRNSVVYTELAKSCGTWLRSWKGWVARSSTP